MSLYSREDKSKVFLKKALTSYENPFLAEDKTKVDESGVEKSSESHKSLVEVEKSDEIGFPYLNESKTVEIYLGRGSVDRTNWRNLFKGKTDNDDDWVISPNVKLFPNSKNIELTTEIEVDYPVEAYIKKFGDNGHIKKLTEAIFSFGSYANEGMNRNATVVLENTRIPAYKSAKNATVPSSLKFDFHFGQAGLFDAFEEVVKPIIVLAKMPMPSSVGGVSFSYLPSTANLQLRLALNFLGTVSDTVKTQLQEKFEKEAQSRIQNSISANQEKKDIKTEKKKLWAGATKKMQDGARLATAITSGIISMVQTTVNQTAEEMGSFIITYGNLVYPPVYITKSKINFNMEQVDEFGYPTSGYVELSGIATISNSSRQLIDRMLQSKNPEGMASYIAADKINVNANGDGIGG